jgi:hypothetical protein
MDLLSTLSNSIPLLVVTLIGGWLLNHRFDRLEKKIDGTEQRVNGTDLRLEGRPTREELNQRFDRIEDQLVALRADLTQIAFALGAQTRPQTG